MIIISHFQIESNLFFWKVPEIHEIELFEGPIGIAGIIQS